MRPARPLIPAVLALVLALAPAWPAAAQVPNARWRTIQLLHVRVTYPEGLEHAADRFARAAETALAVLGPRLGRTPSRPIDVVVTDHVDASNGFTTPFPTNRIVVYAHWPVDEPELASFGDWPMLVTTHELTHAFQLDRAGPLGRALRRVVGRAPASWPLFPAIGTPLWNIEGGAVLEESQVTGFGRVQGTYYEMMVRTASLEGRFAPIDRASSASGLWPPGRWYVYGARFCDWLARAQGEEVEGRIIDRTANALVPAPLAFDRVGRVALGRSFTRAWSAWRDTVEREARAQRDALAMAGLTEPEVLTAEGYDAWFPRVSPDGRQVAFAASDGRRPMATRVLDLETGRWRDLHRRNSLGPASWLPGRALVTSQLERVDLYQVRRDLYEIDARGRERRLTRDARLSDPAPSPDGGRLVALRATREPGANEIVVIDRASGRVRVVRPAVPGVVWAAPRWDPAGRRIAASQSWGGRYGVAVLDTADGVEVALGGDRALSMQPAWSPDGRWVLFSCDRTGVANLYACDPENPPVLRQVTNLVTGAYCPEVSPDGRWIYFSLYRADGWHIARIPYAPESWREAPPPAARFRAPRPGSDYGEPAPSPDVSRPYHALPSLLPRCWVPTIAADPIDGYAYGAWTFGADLVGRHSFDAALATNPEAGRTSGSFSYSFAGLGNPLLSFGAGQSYEAKYARDAAHRWRLASQRERSLALGASLPRLRWRSVLQPTLGVAVSERRRALADGEPGRLLDPHDRLVTGTARLAWNRGTVVNALSISREGGWSGFVQGRRRWELGRGAAAAGGYDEGRAGVTLLRALRGPGFARHVLALRAGGILIGGAGEGPVSLGGVPGGSLDLAVTSLDLGGADYPVRGFPDNVRWGTRAWTAQLEYRFPLLLVDRGWRQWPVLIDRLSGALFVDAGDAWLKRGGAFRRYGAGVDPGGASLTPAPLVGAGGELSTDLVVFFGYPLRLRAGVAFPVRGPDLGTQGYLALGAAY